MKIKNKRKFIVNILVTLCIGIVIIAGLVSITSWVKGLFKPPIQIKDNQGNQTQEEKSQTTSGSENENSNLLKIVNKNNSIPSDYVPGDLVNIEGTELQMRQESATALGKLFDAAKKDNIILAACSGYRSYEVQDRLFDSNVNDLGMKEAEMVSARPGKSEHQLGLAMDVSCGSINYKLEESFGTLPEGIYVKENAHKYGFIIRYPDGKSNSTGYAYEPWHIRYVGEETAKAIYESGKTMEEYFGVK